MCAWEECKNVGVLLLVVALVKETEDSDVPAQLERGKVVVEKREVFRASKLVIPPLALRAEGRCVAKDKK